MKKRGELLGVLIVLVVLGGLSGVVWVMSNTFYDIDDIGDLDNMSALQQVEDAVVHVVELEEEDVECYDECNARGLREYVGEDYRICGNFDSDTCYEWSELKESSSDFSDGDFEEDKSEDIWEEDKSEESGDLFGEENSSDMIISNIHVLSTESFDISKMSEFGDTWADDLGDGESLEVIYSEINLTTDGGFTFQEEMITVIGSEDRVSYLSNGGVWADSHDILEFWSAKKLTDDEITKDKTGAVHSVFLFKEDGNNVGMSFSGDGLNVDYEDIVPEWKVGSVEGKNPDVDEANLVLKIKTTKDKYNVGEEVDIVGSSGDSSSNTNFISGNVVRGDQLDSNSVNQDYITSTNRYDRSGNLIANGHVANQDLEYDGYIVEFKEKPLIKKSLELEEKAVENDMTLSSMSSYNPVKYAMKLFLLESDEVAGDLRAYEEKILSKNVRNKMDIASKLGKDLSALISGNVVGGEEIEVKAEFHKVFNGIALDISSEEAEELKELGSVKNVYPNYIAHTTLTESVPLINADDVWGMTDSRNLEVTGHNITIAIIDSGIDYTHPDFGSCTESQFLAGNCDKVIGGYDFINNDNNPMDDNGHGTHCAGTVAGDGVVRGVAPDAKLIGYKVLDEGGSGPFSGVIDAIERAVDPNEDGDFSDHVDVMSLSLGLDCQFGYNENCGPNDPTSVAVDNAVESGVVVVIAAGNSGPSSETIGTPGTARKAITVGASFDKQQGNDFYNISRLSDCFNLLHNPDINDLACFSSRGPVLWRNGGISKPDVVAPGVEICATQWENAFVGSKIDPEHPDVHGCVDDEHVAISGTSMATPIVAGAAALIKQAHPDWSPLEIKYALKNTAQDLNAHISSQGDGRIDILQAVQLENPTTISFDTPGSVAGIIDIYGSFNVTNFIRYQLEICNIGGGEISCDVLVNNQQSPDDNILLEDFNANLYDSGFYSLNLTIFTSQGSFSEIVFLRVVHSEINPLFENMYGPQVIEIRGFASHINFDYYDLKWEFNGEESSRGIILNQGGASEVVNDILGNWDLSTLNESGMYILKLYLFDSNGIIIDTISNISIFYEPKLKGGFPVSFGSSVKLESITVADLDLDGDEEILIPDERSIHVIDGDGRNIEGWPIEISYTSDISSTIKGMLSLQNGPVVGDINNDGMPEIMIVDSVIKRDDTFDFYLHIFNNDGTYYLNPINIPSSFGSSLSLGDVNGDGFKEIIIVSMGAPAYSIPSKISILKYDGTFLDNWPKTRNVGGDLYDAQGPAAIGDINNDGRGDIIFARTDGTIDVLNFRGDNLLGWPQLTSSQTTFGDWGSWLLMNNVVLGDVDDDGNLEIVYFNLGRKERSGMCGGNCPPNPWVELPKIYVFRNNGSVMPGWPKEIDPENSVMRYPLSLGDIDSDNQLEILIGTAHKLYVFRNNGSVMPGWPIIKLGEGAASIGDIDNDGEKEVLIKDRGSVSVYNSRGIIKRELSTQDFFPIHWSTDTISLGNFDNNNLVDSALFIESGFGIIKLLMYEYPYLYQEENMDWRMFMHDSRHSGCYDCDEGTDNSTVPPTDNSTVPPTDNSTVPPSSGSDSIFRNLGKGMVSGELILRIDKFEDGVWKVFLNVYSKDMDIGPGETKKLDTFWNPENIAISAPGKYRAYAKFVYGSDSFLDSEYLFEVVGTDQPKDNVTDPDINSSSECSGEEMGCNGDYIKKCSDGEWVDSDFCDNGCVDGDCNEESGDDKPDSECSGEEMGCNGDYIKKCIDGKWSDSDFCESGCVDGECNKKAS